MFSSFVDKNSDIVSQRVQRIDQEITSSKNDNVNIEKFFSMINTVNFQPNRTRTRAQRPTAQSSSISRTHTKRRAPPSRQENISSDSGDDLPLIASVNDRQVLVSDDQESETESSSDHIAPEDKQVDWGAPNSQKKEKKQEEEPQPQPEPKPEVKNTKKRRVRVRKVVSNNGEEEDTKTEPDSAPPPEKKKVKRVRKVKVNYDDEETKPEQAPVKQAQPDPARSSPRSKPVKQIKEDEESSTEEIKIVRKSAIKEEPKPLTEEQQRELDNMPLDIEGSENFEVLRKKGVLGQTFTLIKNDRLMYTTKAGKLQIGKGIIIQKKNAQEGELIGFLRQHDRKRRFTFYLGEEESKLGEIFGLCFITPKNQSNRIRQIRICFPKDHKPHFPTTKEQNLSRICMKYGKELDEEQTAESAKEEEETIVDFSDYQFLETQIPHIKEDGSLTLSFGGANPDASMKNFIIRKPYTNKVSVMVFRQSKEMFKVRFAEPFNMETAFGFALAAFVGEG